MSSLFQFWQIRHIIWISLFQKHFGLSDLVGKGSKQFETKGGTQLWEGATGTITLYR